MAITRAQQARQMYNKGSKKPAMQGGGPNYLGKQREVKVPVKWKSSPDHPDTELAYITEPEKKVLIALNMHGGLEDGKPNKGPKGVMSLQGDMGSVGGGGSTGDGDGDARSDRMGDKGKKGPPGGLSDKARGDLQAMTKGLRSSISAQNRAAAAKDFINKVKKISPTYNLVKGITGLFGPKSFNPNSLLGTSDYQGAIGPSSVDDDDENRGGNENMLPMAFNPMTTASSMMNPMTPKQGIGALDLNRIAYRFMADGGFLGDEDEPRQAYGLGSFVKKVVKKATTLPRKLVKTVKKVAKSPTGRLLLAVAAPYALGPAMASSAALSGFTAAQQAALISGATTGITQLASGEDLDLKDIALSAAIGGTSAKFLPPGGKPGVDGKAFAANRASAAPKFQLPRGGGADLSNVLTRGGGADFSRIPGSNISNIIKNVTPEKTGILQSLKNIGTKVKDSKLTDILLRGEDGGISPVKSILLASTLSGLAAKKEQEPDEFSEMDRGPGIDIAAIRRRPFDYMAPRFAGSQFDFYAAEGGQAKKEPVAKKVMPLLDMGGMEKDYREEGGFVPIGRMEKADDVPARLSKNEFVFTADAVRNAGDGDVDKGAEVMYNMMKNLEAGGDVSEESQGLEGARRMFQTSQRLEEIL